MRLLTLPLFTSLVLASQAGFANSQDERKQFQQKVANAANSPFDYTYIQVDYVSFDQGAAGVRVTGSKALSAPLSLIGNVTGSSDSTYLSGGASYHVNVGSFFDHKPLAGMDTVFKAQVEYVNFDSNSELGVLLSGGVRYEALPVLEVYGNLNLTTTVSNKLYLDAGARYYAMDNLQLALGLNSADNNEIYIGARFNF